MALGEVIGDSWNTRVVDERKLPSRRSPAAPESPLTEYLLFTLCVSVLESLDEEYEVSAKLLAMETGCDGPEEISPLVKLLL